jgi:HEAT repeat protein
LFPYLRNPKPEIRVALLGVLGQIGREEARPYIQPLTRDGNAEVEQAAVDALRLLNP